MEVPGKVPGWEDSKGGSTGGGGSSGAWGDRHISKIGSKAGVLSLKPRGQRFPVKF